MIWNETKECMSRDELSALQSSRLVKLVDYVYHNVEFYRKKMQAVGLLPGDIKGIEDIAIIRLSEKDVVRHKLVQDIVLAYEKANKDKPTRRTDKKREVKSKNGK